MNEFDHLRGKLPKRLYDGFVHKNYLMRSKTIIKKNVAGRMSFNKRAFIFDDKVIIILLFQMLNIDMTIKT